MPHSALRPTVEVAVSRGNDNGGTIVYLLLVEIIGHHGLECLLEVRKFAHEVLGEHQVLHVLEFVGESIDEDHSDNVLDGHHASTFGVEDSGEGVLLSKESINIVGEGGGHFELEELEKGMLGYCKAGGTSMSSLGYRVHLEGVVGVGGQDVGRVGSKLHLSFFRER